MNAFEQLEKQQEQQATPMAATGGGHPMQSSYPPQGTYYQNNPISNPSQYYSIPPHSPIQPQSYPAYYQGGPQPAYYPPAAAGAYYGSQGYYYGQPIPQQQPQYPYVSPSASSVQPLQNTSQQSFTLTNPSCAQTLTPSSSQQQMTGKQMTTAASFSSHEDPESNHPGVPPTNSKDIDVEIVASSNSTPYLAATSKQHNEATTLWNTPLSEADVKSFYESYMPWANATAYAARKQQIQMQQQFLANKSQSNVKLNNDGASSAKALQNAKSNEEQSEEFKNLVRQSPSAAAAMKAGLRCPDKLASYIERSFQKCVNAQDRQFMESALQKICNNQKISNSLFTRDWDSMPLPTLPREGPHYTMNNARLENPDMMSASQSLYFNTPQLSSSVSIGSGQPMTVAQVMQQQQQQRQLSQPSTSVFSAAQQISAPNSQMVNLASQRTLTPQSKQPLLGPTASGSSSLSALKNLHLTASSSSQSSLTDQDEQKRKARLEKYGSTGTGSNGGSGSGYQTATRPQKHLLTNQNSQQFSSIDFGGGENGGDFASNIPTVKGTSTKLEKPYFRLTSAVDPSEVRPEEILKKTLRLLNKKWKAREVDYTYIDEQFRSMRQDLVVQRIQNAFTVEVYEAHARIAIECADLDHFNQCQTQLNYLYKQGIEGHKIEFLAYKILYHLFCDMETEILRMLKHLTPEEKSSEPVQHALAVRNALSQGNYGRFFKLFRTAPHLGGPLMDIFIDKHRILCLIRLAMSFVATNIDIGYLAQLLAFDSPRDAELFLEKIGCKVAEVEGGKKKLMCKESMAALKKAPLKLKEKLK